MVVADNYGRFYSLLARMPYADKATLVYQFTNGRTTHLHLMGRSEYDVMCSEMERVSGYGERQSAQRSALRKARSGALRQLQLWGVDTSDWDKVNAFCSLPRIAGKPFRELDRAELYALNRKMRAMIKKRSERGLERKRQEP